ncbi:MAG: GTP cyclohydrolase FolE2 [Verrucomicrobiota bacterium]
MVNEKNEKTSSLIDKQSEQDTRKIRINKVGVRDIQHPIEVMDKAKVRQNTIADLSISVDLPHHFKGTHMSRFVEVLNSHGSLIHVENMSEILTELRERLEAETAHIDFQFPYFIEKEAPVTGARGLMNYEVKFEAAANAERNSLRLSVTTPVTTLCPCSKAISARGAHNQRSYVTITVESDEVVWIEDLVAIAEESASCELFSLLKREDEKFVTEEAYDHPVFVEDLVRNVAMRCNADSRLKWYRIEADNMESIHNHSAFAVIENGKSTHIDIDL